MNLQFFHYNPVNKWVGAHGKYTVCSEIPSKNDLLDLLTFGTPKTIPLNIGYSKVHYKDQYNRKTGREVSKIKMKLCKVLLTNVKILKDNLIFCMETYDDLYRLELQFNVFSKGEKVFFTLAELS